MVAMPGASEQTRRVKALNANWVAGSNGDDGGFEVMVVTEDDRQFTMGVSPASMTRAQIGGRERGDHLAVPVDHER
jgi:hypothetical protein